MDREAWHAAVHGVTKSLTQLSNWTELKLRPEGMHRWIRGWRWSKSRKQHGQRPRREECCSLGNLHKLEAPWVCAERRGGDVAEWAETPGDWGLRLREPGKRVDARALQQVQVTGLGTEWTRGRWRGAQKQSSFLAWATGRVVYLEKQPQRQSEQVSKAKAHRVQLALAEFEIPGRNPNGALQKQLAPWIWGSKMRSGLEMQIWQWSV